MSTETAIPASVQEKVDKIEATTKKGFNLKERLEGRGLRRGSIVLYLDEELGVDLGYATDIVNTTLNIVTGRDRAGIIGDLDAAEQLKLDISKAATEALNKDGITAEQKAEIEATRDSALAPVEEKIAELTAQRDTVIAELTRTGITIHLRAVPPVIQKDCRRLAKASLDITGKGIPDDKAEDFETAYLAHLMTKVFVSITDNATGTVNDDITYDDAVTLMDLLPPSQFARLDLKIGEIQFTDAISRDIESQEDFS